MEQQVGGNAQALTKQLIAATDQLSDAEAAQRYQQILAQLPPQQAAELNAMALSQVSAGGRHTLAAHFKQAHHNPNSPFNGYTYSDEEAAKPIHLGQMSARAQQQDPQLLGGILSSDNPIAGQIGKAALAALAAILIRRLTSGQASGQTGSSGQAIPGVGNEVVGAIIDSLLRGGQSGQQLPGGGDLGGLLGGLLGGSGTSTTSSQPNQSLPNTQPSQPLPGGGDLGDLGGLLGGLLGGSGTSTTSSQPNQSLPNSGGLGGLGGLLGGLLDPGSAAQHTSQGGGLGDILSSILGGTSSDTPGAGSHRKQG